MRAINYIPAIDCLIYSDVAHWINLFETRSNHTPTDIVFPAFVDTGSSYNSTFSSISPRLGDQNTLGHWANEARDKIPTITTWALIIPTLSNLVNDFVALRDQWEQSMEDCCIVNPRVQQMLGSIFKEVRELNVDGVVLDITDVYPNSTSGRYPQMKNNTRPLQNTCFCSSCREALNREAKWTLGGDPFSTADIAKNPFRYVLRPSDRGATPIDVRDNWIDKLDVAKLVEFSTVRGFVDATENEDPQDALKLLRYLSARGKVTAIALKRICDLASENGLRTAIHLGSANYDMSQHTNLSLLLKENCADEYWAFSFENHHLQKKGGSVLLRFLADRGAYYFNSMFNLIEVLSTLSSSLADESSEYVNHLIGYGSTLNSRNKLNLGQCAQVPLIEGLDGFVGIPFGKEEFNFLITRKASDGTLSETHKTEILGKIQSESNNLVVGSQSNPTNRSDPWA